MLATFYRYYCPIFTDVNFLGYPHIEMFFLLFLGVELQKNMRLDINHFSRHPSHFLCHLQYTDVCMYTCKMNVPLTQKCPSNVDIFDI